MEIHIDEIETPIGKIVFGESNGALCALDFERSAAPVVARLKRRYSAIEVSNGGGSSQFRARLEAYFHGDLAALNGIVVDPKGTPFQREVWDALQRIPVVSTASYSDIAATIGRPMAVRAVGLANARNPIAVVIPCHRVVGRDGSLTGYAGGLERKRWLLEHEGCFPQAQLKLL
jgi:methylated-DNA-[protein]-cysteine S-methyltransferase